MLSQFIEAVRRGAIQCVAVHDGAHGDFSYTVGRWVNKRKPELLIIGPQPRRGGSALLEYAELGMETGRIHLPETRLLVQPRPLTSGRLKQYMFWAVEYYGNAKFPAIELQVEKDEGGFDPEPHHCAMCQAEANKEAARGRLTPPGARRGKGS